MVRKALEELGTTGDYSKIQDPSMMLQSLMSMAQEGPNTMGLSGPTTQPNPYYPLMQYSGGAANTPYNEYMQRASQGKTLSTPWGGGGGQGDGGAGY
jgi:hypothetical protein